MVMTQSPTPLIVATPVEVLSVQIEVADVVEYAGTPGPSLAMVGVTNWLSTNELSG